MICPSGSQENDLTKQAESSVLSPLRSKCMVAGWLASSTKVGVEGVEITKLDLIGDHLSFCCLDR